MKTAKGKKANKVVRSGGFWKHVDMTINCVEQLANVLRTMGSDMPAMGIFLGCMLEAKKKLLGLLTIMRQATNLLGIHS